MTPATTNMTTPAPLATSAVAGASSHPSWRKLRRIVPTANPSRQ